MRLLAKSASMIALAMTIVPALLVASGTLSWQTHADLMTAGMILWFVTAPFWMKKD